MNPYGGGFDGGFGGVAGAVNRKERVVADRHCTNRCSLHLVIIVAAIFVYKKEE